MLTRTKQLGKRNLALKYGEAKRRLWQSEQTGDSDLQLEILQEVLLREDRVVGGKSAELSLEILALLLGRIRRGGGVDRPGRSLRFLQLPVPLQRLLEY